MPSETQPYSTVLQYGCVALCMRFFPQNFGTIKLILPGSSSPSHHEGGGTKVGLKNIIYLKYSSCYHRYVYNTTSTIPILYKYMNISECSYRVFSVLCKFSRQKSQPRCVKNSTI